MQKARLFYTTWGSPRRATLVMALIAVFVAALVLWLGATPAFANDPPRLPGPVTDLRVDAVSTTGVDLSWTPPDPGKCPVTYYFIMYYSVKEPNPSLWTVTIPYKEGKGRATLPLRKLDEGTEHHLEIRTTSKKCASSDDCYLYPFDGRLLPFSGLGAWSFPESVTFTTKSTQSTEPAQSQAPKKPPLKPRKLKFSSSDDSVTISWKTPRTRSGRCAHSSYSVEVRDLTDPSGFVPVSRHDISGTSAEVSGLTSGHKYRVRVTSYSAECGQHSPVLKKTYTHP